MATIRVHELSKELNISSKVLVEELAKMNIPVKNHMSALNEQQVKYFKNNYGKLKEQAAPKEASKEEKPKQQQRVQIQTKSDDRAKKPLREGQQDRSQQSRQSQPRQGQQKPAQPRQSQARPTQPKQGQPRPSQPRQRPAHQGGQGGKGGQRPGAPKGQQKPRRDNSKTVRKGKSVYKKEKLKRLSREETGEIIIPAMISVGELAMMINKSTGELIKKLMEFGVMAAINQEIDFETAYIVCQEFEIEIHMEEEEDVVARILGEHFENEAELEKRPPIVTVMGHVDHGKTSLLDAIRNTNVIEGEAGRITQHIGAYTVDLNGQDITFIDTPGHAAFTHMRSRGAKVTDIAILVVAADDGVMPQTIEAIDHSKAAEVPIIVAINKIDRASANPDRVMQELTEHGLVVEQYGGDTICVPISALKGEGISELLEMILLVAEMEELRANPYKPAVGTIIEAQLDQQRGTVATMLVESGTLRTGDFVITGGIYGKIRAMNDENGAKVEEAGPSYPVEVLGFSEMPNAGDKFYAVESDKEAKRITQKYNDRIKIREQKRSMPLMLEDIFAKIQQGNLKEINILLKADVNGSLEAIKASLYGLNNEDVKINIIHGGVGGISETDVTLASASGGIILGFNVRPDNNAKRIAQKEGVDIRTYRVIYELLEDIEDAMKGMLDPEFKEVATGTAEVRQVFKVPNIGSVAGCYITDGAINRNEKVRVIRDGIVIAEGDIASLRRFKDDVKEVVQGYECGIGLDKFNDFKEGDVIEGFKMVEIERE